MRKLTQLYTIPSDWFLAADQGYKVVKQNELNLFKVQEGTPPLSDFLQMALDNETARTPIHAKHLMDWCGQQLLVRKRTLSQFGSLLLVFYFLPLH